MKRISIRFLLLGVGMALAKSSVATPLVDSDKWKVSLNGFVQTDAIHDTTQSYNESPASGAIARPGTYAAEHGRSSFSARSSRLRFDIGAPRAAWNTAGVIEVDFESPGTAIGAGGTETSFLSQPWPRLRHAAILADHDGWHILFGQYWALLGFQDTFLPTSVAFRPSPAMILSRVPQLRVGKDYHVADDLMVETILAASRPAQRTSEFPNLDWGLKFNYSGRKAPYLQPFRPVKNQPMMLAVSGTVRDMGVPGASPTDRSLNYLGYAVMADMMIPIIASDNDTEIGNTLALTGEFSTGKGYGEHYPGWTGNLLSPTGINGLEIDPGLIGKEVGTGRLRLLNLQTFHVALQYHLPHGWDTFVNAWYEQLLSNNAAAMQPAAGQVAYNRVDTVGVNAYYNFTPEIRVGAEYQRSSTRYSDGVVAHNSRVQLSGWFVFY